MTLSQDEVERLFLAEIDKSTFLPPSRTVEALRAALGATTGAGGEVTFAQPVSTWGVAHPLGRKPTVTLYDTSGRVFYADVQATSTTVVVTLSEPRAGSMILS